MKPVAVKPGQIRRSWFTHQDFEVSGPGSKPDAWLLHYIGSRTWWSAPDDYVRSCPIVRRRRKAKP